MRTQDFRPGCPGELVAITGRAMAFVPAPLPMDRPAPAAVIRALGATRGALGALAAGVGALPDPDLLIRPFRTKEATLSSRIEGTRTTTEEALIDEAVGLDETADDDRREIANYERALEMGAGEIAAGRPLGMFLIRGLHRELLASGRGASKQPGELRSGQVVLGTRAAQRDIRLARFIPPPPEHLGPCLDAFDRYLDARGPDAPLLRVALSHYQFETIHPFADGNGRVGRLVVVLQMVHEGLLEKPWLYISPYLEQNREEYITALYRVSTEGAFDAWVLFFLRAVLASANDTLARLRRLRDLDADFRKRLRRYHTQKPLALLPELFARPVLTIPMARKILDTTSATARDIVEKLVSVRILEPSDRHHRPPGARGRPSRVYVVPEILQAISE